MTVTSNEQILSKATALFETFAKSSAEIILMTNHDHDTLSDTGDDLYAHKK